MAMTVYEFIEMTKKEPDKWNHYCEILILSNGFIELARPSHTEKVIEIYCKKMNITREKFISSFSNCLSPISFICEKYRIAVVWYNMIEFGQQGLTRFQKRSLQILQKHKLINLVGYSLMGEYSWYLNHKEERGLPDGL